MTDQDQNQLPAGDDQQALTSGDDLALSALAQAQGKSDDSVNSDDEVEVSNETAETVMSLQNLIEKYANQLDELQGKVKEYREQLANIFENDTDLSESQQQLDAMSIQVKQRKAQLQSNAEVVKLKVMVSELNEEKKEIEETLSNHLVNYYQMTNSKSFDTSDGDQREFEIRAKVRGKGKVIKAA